MSGKNILINVAIIVLVGWFFGAIAAAVGSTIFLIATSK